MSYTQDIYAKELSYMDDDELNEILEDFKPFWAMWFYRQCFPLPKGIAMYCLVGCPIFFYYIMLILISIEGVSIYAYYSYADDTLKGFPPLPEIYFTYRADA